MRRRRRRRCRNPGRNYPLLRAHGRTIQTILPPSPSKLCQARLSPSARASRPVGHDMRAHRRRMRQPSGICTWPAARAPLTGAPATLAGPAASFGGSEWQHFVTRRSLNGTVSTVCRIARKWHGDARCFEGVATRQLAQSLRPSPSAHAFRPSPLFPSSPPLLPPGSQWNRPGEGRKGRETGSREAGPG